MAARQYYTNFAPQRIPKIDGPLASLAELKNCIGYNYGNRGYSSLAPALIRAVL